MQSGQSYQAAIGHAQAKLLFEHLPFVLVGSLVSSTGVALILAGRVSTNLLLAWVTTVYVLCGVRWLVRKQFMAQGDSFDSALWIRVATAFTGMAGVVWGSMGVLFFVDDPLVLMTLVIVLGGMTAGAVSSHSCYLPAYVAYAMPTVSPFAVRCMLEGGSFFWVLGALSLTFMAVNILYGRNLQRNFMETMRLRFENADLVQALMQQKQVAEQASLAKTRFLAAASHDLRQPVQAIELFADVLDRDLQGSPSAPLVGRIRAAGRGLETLLNALLDFSKIDAAAITPDKQHFPVQTLLDALHSDFGSQAERKGLTLRIMPSRLWLHSDPTLLERVLRNFVSNAIKYTPTGRVTVGCKRQGSSVRLMVIDTGLGIPKPAQTSVFKEFVQLDNPERDREKGLGLGLYIAQSLSRLLDHPLALHSVVGKGSTFSLTVPLGIANTTPVAPVTEHARADALRDKTVLLIDDDPNIRMGVTEMLERWDCAAVTAESAHEALELMQISGFVPDAIVADYRLRNEETGVQAIQAIQARWGAVPAAILTGDTEPDRIREASSSGYPLVHKPLSAAKLRALLMHLLEQKQTDA
ncbi:MAG TPA: hybrid sensor histidine kinase/response regulator [Limnobacter sp.]|nr:hybrid sensor histidine kinase/response regulator [Limnobacter sp.]